MADVDLKCPDVLCEARPLLSHCFLWHSVAIPINRSADYLMIEFSK